MPIATQPEPGNKEDVFTALELLKEYKENLTGIAKAFRAQIQLIAVEDPTIPTVQELIVTFKYLSPAVKELARSVSGMIEHGRVEGLDRIALRLRLAELEAALENTLGALRSKGNRV